MDECENFKGKRKSEKLDKGIVMIGIYSVRASTPQNDPDLSEPRIMSDGHGITTAVGLKRHVRDTAKSRFKAKLYIDHGDILQDKNCTIIEKHKIDISGLKLGGVAGAERLKNNPGAQMSETKPKPATRSKPAAKSKSAEKPAAESSASAEGENASGDNEKESSRASKEQVDAFVAGYRQEYWDHIFGAVITKPLITKIRGPVQFSAGISVDPIEVVPLKITRCAVADDVSTRQMNSTFGDQPVVRFGIYRFSVDINLNQAKAAGLTWGCVDELVESIKHMWSETRSNSRTGVAFERLDVFVHDNKMPGDIERELVTVQRTNPKSGDPKSLSEYTVTTKVPPHVEHLCFRLTDYLAGAIVRTEVLAPDVEALSPSA